MSYVALATDRFDAVVDFYGRHLGFAVVAHWDRPRGRGRRFDLGGLRLEVLDNSHESPTLNLGEPGERVHLVVEVADIVAARERLTIAAPAIEATSWGARVFQVRDPDGVRVTFLEWVDRAGSGETKS